ncbi:MAG: acyltransferase family protein [Novosphingobium sp.]|nr:acyltransferase family protein [Novosphingobium sp.]
MMQHRTDIDGLRAVAVLSVILAHAGVPFLQGGFLGVDVFFVISGYLITRIIREGLEDGRFSLLGFYERRARRILPALLVVVAVSIPFAVWLLMPDFLENFGQSVVATLLFSNNLLLAHTSGYWELESAFKPLLHTWSLGVEEQFYIVFPLAMMLIVRLNRRGQIATLAVIAAISVALAEYGWRAWPDASFYLPTTRAWELMIGSLASYVAWRPVRGGQVLSTAALIAVVVPMFVYSHATPSPSIWSAVPVLGTAGVLVFTQPGSLAWRILSLRPAVFIGLISYSAYLWHQPILAFARAASLEPPGPAESAGLVLLTLVLSVLSWRYVETPCRSRKAVPLRPLLTGIGLSAAALIGLGLSAHFARGFPQWRFPGVANSSDVYISYNERIYAYAADTFPDNGRPNIALIGNSFGRDIGNVLIEAGLLDHANMVYLPDEVAAGDPLGFVHAALPILKKADAVVIAVGRQDVSDGLDQTAISKALVDGTDRIVAVAAKESDAPVVVFGSKNFGYNINPYAPLPAKDRAEAMARVPDAILATNDEIAQRIGARYIDVIRLLGPDGKTVHVFDEQGNPLTPDRNHLTLYGARFLAGRLDATRPGPWRILKSLGDRR